MLFNHEYIYNGMFIAIIKEVKLSGNCNGSKNN